MDRPSRNTIGIAIVVVLTALVLSSPRGAAATPPDQATRIEELEARLAAVESTTAGAPTVMTYQGYLADAGGAPLDGSANLVFTICPTQASSTVEWTETHNGVSVEDGYFTVLLGETTAMDVNVFSGTERWLEVTVNGTPMPRQRIASTPYALQAQDGVPAGAIVMWSGSIGSIPDGWALCDGSNGTPDLRDRFIVGAGGSYTVGTTGGEATHTLTIAELPSHSHTITADGAHSHVLRKGSGSIGGQYPPVDQTAGNWSTVQNTDSAGSHNHGGETGSTGSGAAHENRPPYYALAYIMKLP
jgi:microcystin-dependent protein